MRDTAVGSAALAPPLLPGSVQTHRISEVSGERDAREDFLQGQKREPYSVRRMEMAVGGNGKSVDLGYVEKLMAASTTPSLSSLPTPAQLCRKRKNNQRFRHTIALQCIYLNYAYVGPCMHAYYYLYTINN